MTLPAGEQFMAKTRYGLLEPSGEAERLPQPPLELPPAGTGPRVGLPAPKEIHLPGLDLREAIETRRSLRDYAGEGLRLEELSFLLWCTQGVRGLAPGLATFRNVPSAGARHALETFLLVNRVEGLSPGLYRFLAVDHELAGPCPRDDPADRLVDACLGQSLVKAAAATFIWVAVPDRMTWRYAQRGYRYLHLDAGHVCQNLYLAAEAVGCGACAVAAFDDAKVNALLDIDGRRQFAIYLAAVGKKPS